MEEVVRDAAYCCDVEPMVVSRVTSHVEPLFFQTLVLYLHVFQAVRPLVLFFERLVEARSLGRYHYPQAAMLVS